MYQTIIDYFEGNLSAEEKEDLFRKLETDSLWREEFINIQNLHGFVSWQQTRITDSQVIEKLSDLKRKTARNKRTLPWRHWLGYAAAVVLTLLIRGYFPEPEEKTSTDYNEPINLVREFSIPAGQRACVMLQDSTRVWLNARTTLRFPTKFSANERNVELNGEAFFEVKENKNLPFIVSTSKYNIRVTGTSFNVFAYEDKNDFITSLTEGSVTIHDTTSKLQIMTLSPNERAEVVDGKLKKTIFTDRNFLLWKEGIYFFDDMPLWEIMEKLELYYDTTIKIENNRIRNTRFSGKFRQRDGIEKDEYRQVLPHLSIGMLTPAK